MGNNDRAGSIGRIATVAIYFWIAIDVAMIGVTLAVIAGSRNLLGAMQFLAAASIIWLVACGLLFFVWSYRAMSVAHDLTPTLTISPGWSIGWYFVPVATLWKPYEAMREIWKGSAADNETAARAPLIGWWWAAWIGRAILGLLEGVFAITLPKITFVFLFAAVASSIAASLPERRHGSSQR